jgi:hypothetical protein
MKTVGFEEVMRERERLGIQRHASEVFFIARTIQPPVNFLVFGLGNDSPFWSNLNRQGRTVFIEDQQEWFNKVTRELPSLEAYLVDYGTKREQGMQLIDHPEKLAMDLPAGIRNTKWDVILVDGPAGYEDGTPGRMKSIYEASRLVKERGSVFVHDHERAVESAYGARYLLQGNLVAETQGLALLRHYRYQPEGK